jgi:hypothetical protein
MENRVVIAVYEIGEPKQVSQEMWRYLGESMLALSRIAQVTPISWKHYREGHQPCFAYTFINGEPVEIDPEELQVGAQSKKLNTTGDVIGVVTDHKLQSGEQLGSYEIRAFLTLKKS